MNQLFLYLRILSKCSLLQLQPASLLGRLAVDKNYQGKKFGQLIKKRPTCGKRLKRPLLQL